MHLTRRTNYELVVTAADLLDALKMRYPQEHLLANFTAQNTTITVNSSKSIILSCTRSNVDSDNVVARLQQPWKRRGESE